MTSKEDLALIKSQLISDLEAIDIDNCWNETDKEADINWWKEKFQTIEKDLDILEDFIKLFEGEDLEGWIEFDFNYTRENEDSIKNYNGYVSLLKRIRNYLEGIKK